MMFERPHFLLLAPLLAAALTYLHFEGFKRFYLGKYRYTNPLVQVLTVKKRHKRRLLSLALKLLLAVIISLSIAEPYVTVERVVVVGGEAEVVDVLDAANPVVVVVVDVSGSMSGAFTGGVKIEAAKRAVENLVRELPSEFDVGLVSFSDKVELAVPPTVDRGRVLRAIARLKAEGGTVYTYSLETALSWIEPYRAFNATAVVVFTTDGMPSDPEYRRVLEKYRELNVTIYTVYIGNPGETGEKETKYIAEYTGGSQYTASTAAQLAKTFEEITVEISRVSISLEVEVRSERKVTEKVSLRPHLALVSLVLLALLWVIRYRYSKILF